jgi:hypothetical protein
LFCPECGNATRNETEPAAATGDERKTALPKDREITSGRRRGSSVEPLNPVSGRAAGGKDQQVRTSARDALADKVRPGLDKVRKATTLGLDEAASDSGLRFLLVVAVLFVLFLVLLFLSKWMV